MRKEFEQSTSMGSSNNLEPGSNQFGCGRTRHRNPISCNILLNSGSFLIDFWKLGKNSGIEIARFWIYR